MEDTIIDPQGTGETETPTGTPENNNTPIDSQVVKTEKNGKTANDRIRELVTKVKELEAMVPKETENSPSQATGSLGDEAWKKKIELQLATPASLKDKVEDMAAYWSKNPNMSKADIYKVFTPVDELVSQAKQADEDASQTRSGGQPNPSVRQQATDVSQMKTEDLKADLERRISQGERI